MPSERHETIRKDIIALLTEATLSAKEISGEAGIPEKEVYTHLEHIRMTLDRGDKTLNITHPECKRCGFAFKKRDRLKKPSRCPMCKGESIEEPRFSIEQA